MLKYNTEPNFVLLVDWGYYDSTADAPWEDLAGSRLIHRYGKFESKVSIPGDGQTGTFTHVYNCVENFSSLQDNASAGAIGGNKTIDVEFVDIWGFFYQLFFNYPIQSEDVTVRVLLVNDTSIYDNPVIASIPTGGYTGPRATAAEKRTNLLYVGEELLFTGRFEDAISYDLDEKRLKVRVSTPQRDETVLYKPTSDNIAYFINPDNPYGGFIAGADGRSEEHTSELQSH